MALADISDPAAVRRAIEEFDLVGREAFLSQYGIGGARRYVVVENGREYDAKAILAAAHRYQFGQRLESEDFGSGLRSTVPKLRALGFTVSGRSEAEVLPEPNGGGGSAALEQRLREWREETGYPQERDDERREQGRQLAERLSEANLDDVIADPERFEILDFGHLAHNWYGGPGPQSVVHKHLNEGPEAKRRLAQALRHLLYDEGEVADRLDDVLLKESWRMPGFGESLATKSLAVVYPERWLPLYQHSGGMGKLRLIESPELELTAPAEIEERTIGRRIEATNDLLRATTEPLLPGDPWGQMVFLYWLRERQVEAPPPSGLGELGQELLLDPGWLEEVVGLLEEKRQVIFQGPPGTGKTFVARRLGRYFEELGGRSETVQFHPSYAYEDFVEGYRPRVVEGQPGFELVEGPLKRLALDAEADPDHKHLLIIDELNRGNLAKVFGELYFLLEYRGDRIRLQYSEAGADGEDGGRFGLPANLWIVATMNTADRSIALMDAALRRRFYFVDFYPDQAPIDGLLERWLHRHELARFEWVAGALGEANRRLEDRDAAIGPSHIMLADPGALSEERIERIWRHAVLPYLKERLIGEPERLEEFELASLRAAIGR